MYDICHTVSPPPCGADNQTLSLNEFTEHAMLFTFHIDPSIYHLHNTPTCTPHTLMKGVINYSSYISALLSFFFISFCYISNVKVVFIVTPGSIARSLTILSLVRRFGQKRLLNDT